MSLTVEFERIAKEALSRGFAVIPLQSGKKDPDFNLVPKVDGIPGTGGACRRTRDPKVVEQWAGISPNANVGVCSDETITILESDDEIRFRQLVRDVSRNMFGTSRELPSTLTSQARDNRPHFFFRATSKTNTVEGAPGIQGLFEWRRENQYVVGPGSLHPSGMLYQITNNVPIIDMPDWLVDVLHEIRIAYQGSESSHASKYVRVGPAAVAAAALKNDYALDPEAMLADDDFQLFIGAGERHYFLQHMAGLLHDGERTESELVDLLKRLRDRYCEAGKGDYEIENLASWTITREPCVIEPKLPDMMRGKIIYRDKEDFDVAPKDVKTADDFLYRYPAVPGKTREYVLEPKKKFDGWFPRGRPSLVAGSSGTGKSTLILDLLHKQFKREYILSHRGAGLRYLVIFADRGMLANLETLERLGLENAGLPIDYMRPVWGIQAVDAIKTAVENFEHRELPQVVFVEGGDMLVEEASKKRDVCDFMEGLQRLSQHYHLAIILSVGAPKVSKQNAPLARRDMVFGSEAWSRLADTVLVLTTDGDGTSGIRKLTVQHRNDGTESFDLKFEEGHLVEVTPAAESEQSDPILAWMETQKGEFTSADGWKVLSEAGVCKRSTFHARINSLVKEGVLSFRYEDNKRYLKVVKK